jgi:predicted RNA-binding protein with TRAM domain
VEIERKLRELAGGSRGGAFRVELNPHVASILIGPGAERLQAIEERTRRRFFIATKDGVSPEHFEVLDRGPLAKLQPESPVEEGQELELKLVEVGLHDSTAGVAKHEGIDISVAHGAALVGKRVKIRVSRVMDGTAYAEILGQAKAVEPPITAEAMAEKPTRQRRKAASKQDEPAEDEPVVEAVAEDVDDAEEADGVEEAEPEPGQAAAEEATDGQPRPRKRTRRGSRGGRRRKKKPAGAAGEAQGGPAESEAGTAEAEAETAAVSQNGEPAQTPVLIHIPDPDLGEESSDEGEAGEATTEGAQARPKKRTRRGSRGGRRRRKPAGQSNGAGVQAEAAEKPAEPLVE